MTAVPDIRYARCGDVSIAHQVVGVRDLVEGCITFEDVGERALEGVPVEWRL